MRSVFISIHRFQTDAFLRHLNAIQNCSIKEDLIEECELSDTMSQKVTSLYLNTIQKFLLSTRMII